ncbi:MAG: hypothetical protein IJ053_04650, partial [Lachnospiraceae bacterium]|nr:hypothetical protein [Lachnospiraceae bacterium]
MNELTIKNVLNDRNKYNLALAFTEERQLNPFYKTYVKEVLINPNESAGEVFKVGSKKDGDNWKDIYALTKPALQKLATEAGIQFKPAKAEDVVRIDDNTWQATAYGAIRLPDGSVSTTPDSKIILLDAEERKYRRQAEKRANEGIKDAKAAKTAAENYKGSWVETEEVDKNGRPIVVYKIAEEEKTAYINACVSEAMAQLRVNAPQKAMTGAKLRVIRALLAIKSTYTKEELYRPFAIATATFSPDYNDPSVKSFLLQQAAQSAVSMFGATPQPVMIEQPQSQTYANVYPGLNEDYKDDYDDEEYYEDGT